MESRRLLRLAVVGATGAVGGEVLNLIEARRFPLQEIVPIATERSVGESVEVLGHEVPVVTGRTTLTDLDLALVCTPRDEALPWVRLALESRVPCIDLSGAAAATPEVPLLAADRDPDPAALAEPVIASPPGSVLAWVRVLAPLRERAGIRRVVATTVEPVSAEGRPGIRALEAETIALFNQQEPPEPTVFHHGIAFDCLPATGELGSEGCTDAEETLVRDVSRLLGEAIPMAVTSVRVPIFAGAGASLALETARPLTPGEGIDLLAKVPGVSVCEHAAAAASTRETVGGDDVLVGRVRRDPSTECGLLLWLAADPIQLAASNALRLAEARFALE